MVICRGHYPRHIQVRHLKTWYRHCASQKGELKEQHRRFFLTIYWASYTDIFRTCMGYWASIYQDFRIHPMFSLVLVEETLIGRSHHSQLPRSSVWTTKPYRTMPCWSAAGWRTSGGTRKIWRLFFAGLTGKKRGFNRISKPRMFFFRENRWFVLESLGVFGRHRKLSVMC